MKRPSRLRAYIERDAGALTGVLRLYLSRAGITDQPLESAANDLLNDVIVEALAHETRFRDDGQPRAWLLGIAANLIRRRQAEQIRRNQREPLARDLFADEALLSDDELFDRVAALATPDQGDPAIVSEINAMLGELSLDDQQVIRLAVFAEMDGEALAVSLGTTPGAARVRLHRALGRLKQVYGKAIQDA